MLKPAFIALIATFSALAFAPEAHAGWLQQAGGKVSNYVKDRNPYSHRNLQKQQRRNASHLYTQPTRTDRKQQQQQQQAARAAWMRRMQQQAEQRRREAAARRAREIAYARARAAAERRAREQAMLRDVQQAALRRHQADQRLIRQGSAALRRRLGLGERGILGRLLGR